MTSPPIPPSTEAPSPEQTPEETAHTLQQAVLGMQRALKNIMLLAGATLGVTPQEMSRESILEEIKWARKAGEGSGIVQGLGVAASLVCEGCKTERPLHIEKEGAWWHHIGDNPKGMPCVARPIHERLLQIAENTLGMKKKPEVKPRPPHWPPKVGL